jgi:hypothetical protein
MRLSKFRALSAIAIVLAVAAAMTSGSETVRSEAAYAAVVDHYRVQLAAWIPQASVDGPQPDSKCFGYIWSLASYNGNNHVGFDGEYKATVTYDFTYDGSRWADVAVSAEYGPTYANDGICTYHGQATSAAGVTPTASGVTMWIRAKNPLVGLAPPIIANIDLSFSGTDQMLIKLGSVTPGRQSIWLNLRILGSGRRRCDTQLRAASSLSSA